MFLIYNHIVSFEALLSRALRSQVNFSFNIIVYFSRVFESFYSHRVSIHEIHKGSWNVTIAVEAPV